MIFTEVNDCFESLLGKTIEQAMLLSVFDGAATGQAKYYVMPQKNNEEPTREVAKSALNYLAFLQKWSVSRILMLANRNNNFSDLKLYSGFQLPDEPVNVRSLSGQGRKGWDAIRLIPDHYYFSNRGYENFLAPGDPAVIPWDRRRAAVFWRGSTTGYVEGGPGFGRYIDSFEGLPRYRLCRLAANLGPVADMGIYRVVQAGIEDQVAIEARLSSEGLMRQVLPMRQWAEYKFIVDIDGNVSAWNFVQRMKLGCCVLKVDSPWIQWFDDRIAPWVHFVPVASDFSDLQEKIDWCLAHDKEAEQIANQAREFALSLNFATEMQEAAFRFVEVSEPIDEAVGQDFLEFQNVVSDIRAPQADLEFGSGTEKYFLRTSHNTILGRADDGAFIQLSRNAGSDRAVFCSGALTQEPDPFRGWHVHKSIDRLTLEKDDLYLRANDDKQTTSLLELESHCPGKDELFELILDFEIDPDPVALVSAHQNKIILTAHDTLLGVQPDGALVQITSLGDVDKIIIIGQNENFNRLISEFILVVNDGALYLKKGVSYACAESDRQKVVCDRPVPLAWETFRLISTDAVRFSVEKDNICRVGAI